MTDTSTPKNEHTCEHCSGQLSPLQFSGLCPRCLFAQVTSGISADDHPALRPIAITGKCPTIDQLNQELAEFKFLRMLGRGASGWTFLATQISLAREVAVKILPRKLHTDKSAERFRMEAENLAKLNHQRIVTAHDFGSTANFHFIVMEYVAGKTLRTRMQHQTLTVEEATEVVRQICEATQYAHRKGLLHRDIKPENVLFVGKSIEDGIKVADFGIAKITDQSATRQNLTYTGVTMGTPFYMAPEQSVAGQTDFRADVYSIGVLFYELLTGRLPLGRFPPPSHTGRGNPKLDSVVFRALANRVDDRLQSADEFLSALENVNKSKPNWKSIAVGLLSVGLLIAAVISVASSFSGKPTKRLDQVSLPTATEMDATAAPHAEPARSSLTETKEKPFEENLAIEKAAAEGKTKNVPSEPITPDATVNQLMLEQVKWSVLPNAEKPATVPRSTNRVISFGKSLSSKPFHDRLSDVVLDRDRKSAIAIISNAFEDFSVLLSIDTLNAKVRCKHKLPDKQLLPIAVSSTGTRAVTLEKGRGSKPGKLSFWDTSGDDLKLKGSWMTSSSFDQDGFSPESGMLLDDQHLLTFGKRVILWNTQSAQPVYSYPSATKPTFDAHSNRLAFRSGSTIWIVKATEGKVLGTLECDTALKSLAFSPSGNRLAGCSTMGEVWIWNLADGSKENSGNTPSSRAGSIAWAGEDNLLVDGQYLIDVRLAVAVWKYKSMFNPLVKFGDDRFWIASKTKLRPLRIPHKTIDGIARIKPDQLLVLKPGVSVALKSDLTFSDQECSAIDEALKNKLKAIGITIEADSDLTLEARVVVGKKQSADMSSFHDPFGRRGLTTISFTPHLSTLSLKRGDQMIWSRQRNHSVNPTLYPQQGETLQQAADRECTPTTDFFSSCKLPHNLKTLPKEYTLGESSLDQSR